MRHPAPVGSSLLPSGIGERGAWIGLSDKTTVDDLARAAVEAMVFSMRRGVELLDRPFRSVRMSGGGARPPVVPQMLADLLGVPVSVMPDRSASAIGAAMLAAAGVGQQVPVTRAGDVLHDPVAAPELEGAYELWLRRVALSAG